jgi:hypothetical protein
MTRAGSVRPPGAGRPGAAGGLGLPRRAASVALAVLIAGVACGGCRDIDVVTGTYATLQEAEAEGAVKNGWIPAGLPPGSRELREAHDLDSSRRWGLFNFPKEDAPALRSLLGDELPVEGLRCRPPRRIEWWPLVLREELDPAKVGATGLRLYTARRGDLVFAVNWNQGRAYYWTRDN